MYHPKINTHSEVMYFVVLKVYFIQEELSWCPEKLLSLEGFRIRFFYKTFALRDIKFAFQLSACLGERT